MKYLTIVYLLHIFVSSSSGIELLNKFALYEVTAFNNRERAVLFYLYIRNEMIIFLNGVTNEAAIPMDILVDKCCLKAFEKKLEDNDIEYIRIEDKNISKQINPDKLNNYQLQRARIPNITNDFYDLQEHQTWVYYKTQKYPILSEIVIGTTYERRNISILKISTGKKNMAVFLLGGEDGRDWISPAILYNFVDYLVEHSINEDFLLKYYDFYVLPLFNPDGYDYSRKTDRYWAKNKKVFNPHKSNCLNKAAAIGVNLDKNWFFNRSTIVKDEECDSVYMGSKSLSEEETEALSEFLNNIAPNLMVFINLKGFERLITIPYTYTNAETANNYALLMDIISSVLDKLKSEYNNKYYYGSGANYLFNFTGSSADWVKRMLNIPIVYTIQMKFESSPLPKPQDIEPLTKQFFIMLKEILLLANSIYSPMFNNQMMHACTPTTVIVLMFIQIFYGFILL